MNITLSAPAEVIAEVRDWAEKNHTSLNEYIRDCLVAKSNEIRAARQNQAQQFRKFATENPIVVSKDFKFSRVESVRRKPRGKK